MPKQHPYLRVPGKCREMMDFYSTCLDARLTVQTVAESPVENQMPAGLQDQIMHSMLLKGDLVIMATDMSRSPGVPGNNVQRCVMCTIEEEFNRYFSLLSAEGETTEPLRVMFWGSYFEALTNRYGIHWLFNFEPENNG